MPTTTRDPLAHFGLSWEDRVRLERHYQSASPIVDADVLREMVRKRKLDRKGVQALVNHARDVRNRCLRGDTKAIHNAARWQLTYEAAQEVLDELGGPILPAWCRAQRRLAVAEG